MCIQHGIFLKSLDRAILTQTMEENKKRRSRLEKLKEKIKQQEKESKSQNVMMH